MLIVIGVTGKKATLFNVFVMQRFEFLVYAYNFNKPLVCSENSPEIACLWIFPMCLVVVFQFVCRLESAICQHPTIRITWCYVT